VACWLLELVTIKEMEKAMENRFKLLISRKWKLELAPPNPRITMGDDLKQKQLVGEIGSPLLNLR